MLSSPGVYAVAWPPTWASCARSCAGVAEDFNQRWAPPQSINCLPGNASGPVAVGTESRHSGAGSSKRPGAVRASPPRSGFRAPHPQPLAGRQHRTFSAFQAQVERLAVVAGGADRQRLLTPFGQCVQCLVSVHLQAKARALTGSWQHFQRHLGEQAQAAETGDHQS